MQRAGLDVGEALEPRSKVPDNLSSFAPVVRLCIVGPHKDVVLEALVGLGVRVVCKGGLRFCVAPEPPPFDASRQWSVSFQTLPINPMMA